MFSLRFIALSESICETCMYNVKHIDMFVMHSHSHRWDSARRFHRVVLAADHWSDIVRV